MIKFIKTLESKIKKGYIITYNEALKLSTIENEKDLDQLMNSAYKINLFFNGKKVDLCSIINGKCGKCSEDCKFCAQSAHYKTNILEHELVSYEKVLKEARENQLEGCNRFSLVTSGRGLAGDDFFKILEIYNLYLGQVKSIAWAIKYGALLCLGGDIIVCFAGSLLAIRIVPYFRKKSILKSQSA